MVSLRPHLHIALLYVKETLALQSPLWTTHQVDPRITLCETDPCVTVSAMD